MNFYRILGVDRLDPDDNILQRGNLNTNNDTSLSHNKNLTTKTKLKKREYKFKIFFNEKDKELRDVDKKIKAKRVKEAQISVI